MKIVPQPPSADRDREVEAAVLNHYLGRVPDLEEVRVSVVAAGGLVRFVLLRPGRPAVTGETRPGA